MYQSNSYLLGAAALALTAALSAGCGGGGGGTTTFPSGGLGNNGGALNISQHATVIGSGGGAGDGNSGSGDPSTQLHVPGGGGSSGSVDGASFVPAVTVPPVESFQANAPAGTDDVKAWLIDCFETLPDPATSNSGVFQNASLETWAAAVFDAVNQARAQNGLGPVQLESHLEAMAQAHARDMALRNYFSHDSPDGVLMWDRWQALKVPYTNWAGENAAMGQETAQKVVDEWLQSPGHRANMLSDQAQWGAVGVYFDTSDTAMPIHVIAEFANFRDDPATNAWYERGDVFKK